MLIVSYCKKNRRKLEINKKIVVAGTDYVDLFIAALLAQYNHVNAVDVITEKIEMINNREFDGECYLHADVREWQHIFVQ